MYFLFYEDTFKVNFLKNINNEKDIYILGNVKLRDDGFNLIICTNKSPIIQKREIIDEKNIHILKSNLQKQIRRNDLNSLETFNYMIKYCDNFELMRRLIIIACEDCVIDVNSSVICWLMCATSKNYVIKENIIEWLRKYIYVITLDDSCLFLSLRKDKIWWDDLEDTLSFTYMVKDLKNKKTNLKIFILSHLIRKYYGGLKFDLIMLCKILDLCKKNKLVLNICKNLNDLKIDFVNLDTKLNVLNISIDFHVKPNITKIIQKQFSKYSEIDIKKTIWHCCSGINYRDKNKIIDKKYLDIWKDIENNYISLTKFLANKIELID